MSVPRGHANTCTNRVEQGVSSGDVPVEYDLAETRNVFSDLRALVDGLVAVSDVDAETEAGYTLRMVSAVILAARDRMWELEKHLQHHLKGTW